MYNDFLVKYEKTYASNPTEYEARFRIFKDNIQRAYAYSKLDSSASYGVTQFSDMTPQEFAMYYRGTPRTPEQMRASLKNVQSAPTERKFNDLPTSFDWRDKGAVSKVKNQGMCGSCWAFSTVANVESVHFLKKGSLDLFSEQVLVDCDRTCDPDAPKDCDEGCNGGLMHLAMTYIQKEGLPTEDAYPYTARDGTCHYTHGNGTAVEITGFKFAPTDADGIASFLMEHGALSVALNAEYLQFYTSGISDPLICDPKSLDHGVTMVGFGVGKNMWGTEIPYWIVKNSWGGSWGEKGYFRIRKGKDTCGIESYVVTSLIDA